MLRLFVFWCARSRGPCPVPRRGAFVGSAGGRQDDGGFSNPKRSAIEEENEEVRVRERVPGKRGEGVILQVLPFYHFGGDHVVKVVERRESNQISKIYTTEK